MHAQMISHSVTQNTGHVTETNTQTSGQLMPIGLALQKVHNVSVQPATIKIQECATKERKLLANGSIFMGTGQIYLEPHFTEKINATLINLHASQKITEKSAQTTVTRFTGMAVVAEVLRWVSSVALLANRNEQKNLNSLAYNKNTDQALFSDMPQEGFKPLYRVTENAYTYDYNQAENPDQVYGYGKLQKNPQWTPEVQAIFIGDRLLLGTNARRDNPNLGDMIKSLLQNPTTLEQELIKEIENKNRHLRLCNQHIKLHNLYKKLSAINTELAEKKRQLSHAQNCIQNASPKIKKVNEQKRASLEKDIHDLENQKTPLEAQKKEIESCLINHQIEVLAPPPTEQEVVRIQEKIRQITQAKNHLRQLSNFALNQITEVEWLESARVECIGQILGIEKKELEAQLTTRMLLGIQRALSKDGTIILAGQPKIDGHPIEGMVHAEQRLAEYIQNNQERLYNNFINSLELPTTIAQDQAIPLPFAGTKPACTVCDDTFNNRNLKAEQKDKHQQNNTSPYFTLLTFGDKVQDENGNAITSIGKCFPDSYAPYELFIDTQAYPNSDISRAFSSPQKKAGLSLLAASGKRSN